MRTTSRAVNSALRKAGINGEIVQGRGYVYFVGDDFDACYSTSVAICWLSHSTVEEWVEEAIILLRQASWMQTPTEADMLALEFALVALDDLTPHTDTRSMFDPNPITYERVVDFLGPKAGEEPKLRIAARHMECDEMDALAIEHDVDFTAVLNAAYGYAYN